MTAFQPDPAQQSLLHNFLLFTLLTTTLNYSWPTNILTTTYSVTSSWSWSTWTYSLIIKDYCAATGTGTFPITFDYIVVGSGAAGSTIANRLAKNSSRTVLLIEAGAEPLIESVPPRLFPFNLNNSATYNYYAQNSSNYGQGFKGGVNCNCGKSIGGSTEINAMVYVCGTDDNYNQWALKTNDASWNFTNFIKYIRRHQNIQDTNMTSACSSYYGTTGPLAITNVGYNADTFISYLRTAAIQAGYSDNSDYNCGSTYNGFFNLRMTIFGGQRESAARAYLIPLNTQPNFYYMKNAFVKKVIATKNSSGSVFISGVNVLTSTPSNCPSFTVKAKREVIISAGGYGSPQILQRSGFGKAADLATCSTPQVAELPVGYNLADHITVVNFYKINNYNPVFSSINVPAYLTFTTSLAFQYAYTFNDSYFQHATSLSYQGFINVTNSTAKYPDVQSQSGIYDQYQLDFDVIIRDRFGFIPSIASQIINASNYGPVVQVLTSVLNPISRGTVKLGSCSNPYAYPIINGNYFSDPTDVSIMLKGLQAMCAYYNTPVMQSIGATPLKVVDACNNYTYCSDDYNSCYIKYMTLSLWHPTGTCKMGTSSTDSVVDSKLRVFNVVKTATNPMLRVADASIIPVITTGNTQCPTYAVGEKAADMIITDNY